MKNAKMVLIILFYSGCFTMFERKETLMGQLKLKDNSVINLIDAGSGATSPDVIWINRISERGEKVIIDSIHRSGHLYSVSFEQINDTILNITLTDTAVFKGKKIDRLVNLNNRIVIFQ